ncbi:MAG TPA: hypothetical protein VMF06_18095 [Candidatus Limnocylindria bacterium]|nr:hypothetical protein [Candidatus Limnocylindria bacterium]
MKTDRTGCTAISCVVCWFMLLVVGTAFAAPRAAKELPGEVTISQDIKIGAAIYLTLTLENGTPVVVLLDTGSAVTHLDESLVPYLGPKKGTTEVIFPAMGWITAALYNQPKLFLNGTELKAEGKVQVYPFRLRPSSGTEIRGILGLNCLKHYCLQIDPEAGKLRFLKSGHFQKSEAGRYYSMVISQDYEIAAVEGNLLGDEDTGSIVDTGWSTDGALQQKNFRKALRRKGARLIRQGDPVTCNPPSAALLPVASFHMSSYTNVVINDARQADIYGLRFLARHVATLDFPDERLYLRRIDDSITVSGNGKAGIVEATRNP